MRPTRRQRGQVLPIFALMALVIVGVVALAVDFGFLTDQHRNLQTWADHAAIAGAEQLSGDGNGTANARKSAMVYIRDNLGGSFTLAANYPCGVAYTSDVDDCTLPSPYGNYKVSIHTPGKYSIGCPYQVQCNTVSVEIKDTVANTLAAVAGINTTTVDAFAEARAILPNQPLQTAFYSDGCINTSSVLVPIVVDGDIYLNECTVKPALAGGFCAVTTPTSNGNIILGPQAFLPGSILQGQNLLNCQAQLAGIVTSMGRIKQVANSFPPPALPGPPGAAGALQTAGATHPCKNGTVKLALGVYSTPSNCYDPGSYDASHQLTGIANNLNPGVYYVDISSGTCYNDSSVSSCGGVYFSGNTMNANLNGVIDKCWAPLNVPSTNTFVSPCPDGTITDPTLPSDPQCATVSVAATAPLTVNASAALAPASTLAASTTYYVRVSALTAIGESAASTEVSATTSVLNKTIHISMPAASVGETGGYNVYIGTATNTEQLALHIAHPVLPIAVTGDVITPPAASAQHYPLFDNSQCLTGFHNIPHSKDQSASPGLAPPNQNFGVTFVLTGKAGICMGSDPGGEYCTPSAAATTVILNPYCASGFTPNPESKTCTNASAEDGAYAVYGSSQGAIRTSGLLAAMNMSGTVYLPQGSLKEDVGSRFSLTPGQMVVHDASLNVNTNLLYPLVNYSPVGAVVPPTVALIQ